LNATTPAKLLPSIDVSPEALLARAKRIEAATVASRLRTSELELAREIYRRHGIRDDAELLRALQSVHANCQDSPYRDRLMELMLDMDAEQWEPEITSLEYSGRERGEFGAGTPGVRGRAA
jgi:hypothetical protein